MTQIEDASNRIKGAISFALVLHGDKLDPQRVTSLLGIKPSKAWKKGDVHTTYTGNKVIRKSGLWKLTTQSNSPILSDHIDEFLSKLSLERGIMEVVPEIEQATFSIFSGELADNTGAGAANFDFSAEHLAALQRFGANIECKLSVTTS